MVCPFSNLLKTLEKRLTKCVELLKERIPDLDGVLTNTKSNDKRKYPDDQASTINISFQFASSWETIRLRVFTG